MLYNNGNFLLAFPQRLHNELACALVVVPSSNTLVDIHLYTLWFQAVYQPQLGLQLYTCRAKLVSHYVLVLWQLLLCILRSASNTP